MCCYDKDRRANSVFVLLQIMLCFISLSNMSHVFLIIFQKLDEEKHDIEKERDEKLAIIEKMNQAAKDREVEFRVAGKKNDQLVSTYFLVPQIFL